MLYVFETGHRSPAEHQTSTEQRKKTSYTLQTKRLFLYSPVQCSPFFYIVNSYSLQLPDLIHYFYVLSAIPSFVGSGVQIFLAECSAFPYELAEYFVLIAFSKKVGIVWILILPFKGFEALSAWCFPQI